jgi:hypothetical protein
LSAQQQGVRSIPVQQRPDTRFVIIPTQNIWNMLLLDSSNGRVWQMQFTVSDTDESGQWPVNSEPLVTPAEEKPGRFAIYSTQNLHNFILLDQIDGRAWQIQWSTRASGRGIVRELSVQR